MPLFAELNAEKQRLQEKADSTKAANESSISELPVQVANLSNDLTRTMSELHMVQQRADALAAEVEYLRVGAHGGARTDAAVCTEHFVFDSTVETCPQESRVSEEQLFELEQQLAATSLKMEAMRKSQEVTHLELEHYKITLVQTEAILGKLQKSVQQQGIQVARPVGGFGAGSCPTAKATDSGVVTTCSGKLPFVLSAN
ncbi:hypothetical protein EG68_02046 [Paragonimus skrjabini miyazakii]|uniref:Uncharacterized protein n=1 Tax=Paragonimus skrjabini miyazakii TaxID=59628 RepID=A0A8S9Z030_9TREM|nr:hypothetical protein EG68_02046 [Paragonimus skrjabini miyazakii]